MGILLLLFVLLSIVQFCYIISLNRQAKSCLAVLQGVRNGGQLKIFTKSKGVMGDISCQLNGIIEDYREKMVQLKRADEANKQLLTSLSHDVRTPLASLLGYLEALDTGLSGEEQKEYISVATQKAGDLKTLIDMLFQWFKLNSREQEFAMEAADINEMTRELLIHWLPVLEQSHISLSVCIGDGDLMVQADPLAYQRIVNNLLQNAVKHGACSRITVSVGSSPDGVLLKVANNGIPIPKDQLPHIFRRLYRCDSSRSGSGSGLGLAIAKELAAAMGGEISVSSEPGADTEFLVTLPSIK